MQPDSYIYIAGGVVLAITVPAAAYLSGYIRGWCNGRLYQRQRDSEHAILRVAEPEVAGDMPKVPSEAAGGSQHGRS